MNGPTKFFFDDPATDRLLTMVMALGAEVAALREEMHTLRLVIEDKGFVTADDLASYAPSTAALAERDRMRETMIANLLYPLQQECQILTESMPATGRTS